MTIRRRWLVVTAVGLASTGLPGVLAAASSENPLDTPIVALQTLAGAGQGDGSLAVEASLEQPSGLAVLPDGSVLIADTGHHRVRVIDPRGVIHAHVGSGALGETLTPTAGIRARLSTPSHLAREKAGGIFICDTDANRVYLLERGQLTLVAGTGDADYNGDGGPGPEAALNHPEGIAVDSDGRLLIADSGNSVIRRLDAHGVITTVAGGGDGLDGSAAVDAALEVPAALAFEPSGTLLIAESGRIRRIDAAGVIGTVAGTGERGDTGDGGAATDAMLDTPSGLAVSDKGVIYVADTGNDRVRKIDPTGVISTVAGTGIGTFAGDGGPATTAGLSAPSAVAVAASGELLITDQGNARIRAVDAFGRIRTIAGDGYANFTGDGGPAASAALASPAGLDVDKSGSVVFADRGNHRVRKVGTDGAITTIAGDGFVSCGPAGSPVAGDCGGRYAGDGGPATRASLSLPAGVAAATDGSIFIADSGNNVVRRVSPTGTISTVAGSRANAPDGTCPNTANASVGLTSPTATCLSAPSGLALDTAGNLYICDTGNGLVRKLTPSGSLSVLAGMGRGLPVPGGSSPALTSALAEPRDVAVDGAGDVYVADAGGNVVRMISAESGLMTTVAGTGERGSYGDGGAATAAALNAPGGIGIGKSGELYIADTGNNEIREVDAGGRLTRFAGGSTTTAGFLGDGGPALSGQLLAPTDVAVGSNGVLLADTGANRIRFVGPYHPQSQLTISLNHSAIVAGNSAIIFGRLTRTDTDEGLAGAAVRLVALGANAAQIGVTVSRTEGNGDYTFAVRPVHNTSYGVEFAGSKTFRAAASSVARLAVMAAVSVTSPSGANARTRSDVPYSLSGKCAPADADAVVYLRERRRSGDRTIMSVRVAADGTYRFRKSFSAGSYTLYVQRPGSERNLAGSSRLVTLQVT